MTVEKFRNIADAVPASASKNGADNLRAAFELAELGSRLSRRTLDPGIRRFHSIEEAAAKSQLRGNSEQIDRSVDPGTSSRGL